MINPGPQFSPAPVVFWLLPQAEKCLKSSSGGEIGGMTVAEMPLIVEREIIRNIQQQHGRPDYNNNKVAAFKYHPEARM